MRSIPRALTAVGVLSALAILPSTQMVHAVTLPGAAGAVGAVGGLATPGTPGSWSDADLKDTATHKALSAAVAKLDAPRLLARGERYVVENINVAKVQVVAGFNYAFDFRAARLVGDELTTRVRCAADVWVRPWENSTQVTMLGCISDVPVTLTALPAPIASPVTAPLASGTAPKTLVSS